MLALSGKDQRTWFKKVSSPIAYHIKRKTSFVSKSCPKIHVELTNHCNLDCLCCDRKSLTRELGMMEMPLFKKIIDNASEIGIAEVKLNRFGESTMHPRLIEMISYTKRKGIPWVYFNTNGTLLNEKLSMEILNSGLDSILFSVDGVSASSYEEVRKNANYEEVISNIERFSKMRKENGLKKPMIIMNTILLKNTQNEIKGFFRKWSPLVDIINIFPVFQYGNLENLSTIDKPSLKKRIGACNQVFIQLMIFWDGNVTVCGADINGELCIGNVLTERLEELWKNQKITALRKMHREKKFSEIPVCTRCDGIDKTFLKERAKLIKRIYRIAKKEGTYS